MMNTKERAPKRYCNVAGCFANSKWQPDAAYFQLPTNPVRKEDWLKKIKRDYKLNKELTLYVCDKHFEISDILITPCGKKLKAEAVPTKYLPRLLRANPLEKEVQVSPTLDHVLMQTVRNFKSDNVVQVGPSFTTEYRRNQKLKEELEKYQNHLKMIESGELSYIIDLFHKSCDKLLSPSLSELIKDQTKLLSGDSDKKTNLHCLEFCLNLYHASPKAYAYLKDDLQLPSIATLKSMVIPISTEVTEETMAPLKLKVSSMVDIEKYCSVMVDVMPLKSFLSYNSKEDKIVGFHEINGVQMLKPARRAVVVVVRGLFVDWTQPVGFSMISDMNSSRDISKWIDKILINLINCGLKVKTFVCTAKSKYLDERNIRFVTIDRPYFMINDVKIFYMFDIPHMLRQLRNYLLSHTFSFRNGDLQCTAKIDDVKEFYELDKTRALKFAPKLTSSHITPSKSEKKDTMYATQLLSRSVATGLSSYIDFKVITPILPCGTVDFVLLINNLFDLHNASTPNTAYFGKQWQKKVFEESLLFFNSLKLINSRTGIERTNMPTFVEGFQITIKAILCLYKELQMKEECKPLMTRRLNLEVTHKLIKRMKPKGKIIPVSQRFMQRFRKLYLSYILQPLKKGTPINFGALLSQLNVLKNNLGKSDQISEALVNCEQELPKEILLEMAKNYEESRTYHFCGFLLKKCVQYHNNCEILRTFVEAFELMYGLVVSEEKAEPISSGEFIDYVALMENHCRNSFKMIPSCCHVGSQMYNTLQSDMASLAFTLPCSCFPVEFLQKLFIRLRIYMFIYYNNSFYRTNRFKGKSFSFPSL